jgi:serine/threonine protein kinase
MITHNSSTLSGATASVSFIGNHAIKIFNVVGFIEHEKHINSLISSSNICKSNLLLWYPYTYRGVDCLIGARASCDANRMIGQYSLAGKLLEDIFGALSELHRIGICHRDVTLSNILYDGHKFMLSDFGHSVVCDTYSESSTHHLYMDTREIKDKNSDFYSLSRCIHIFLGTHEVKRSHFTSTKYWRLYNDCRNKVPVDDTRHSQLRG